MEFGHDELLLEAPTLPISITKYVLLPSSTWAPQYIRLICQTSECEPKSFEALVIIAAHYFRD